MTDLCKRSVERFSRRPHLPECLKAGLRQALVARPRTASNSALEDKLLRTLEPLWRGDDATTIATALELCGRIVVEAHEELDRAKKEADACLP